MFKFGKKTEEVKPITITVLDEATLEELDVVEVEVEESKAKDIVLDDMNTEEDYFDMDFKKNLMDMFGKEKDKSTFQKHIMDACSSYAKDEESKVLTDEEQEAIKAKKLADEKTAEEAKAIADALLDDGNSKELEKSIKAKELADEEERKAIEEAWNKRMNQK